MGDHQSLVSGSVLPQVQANSDEPNDFLYLDADGFMKRKAFGTALENMQHNAFSMQNIIRAYVEKLRSFFVARQVSSHAGPVINGVFRIVGLKELGKGVGRVLTEVERHVWKDIHDMCEEVTRRTCEDLENSAVCVQARDFQIISGQRVMDVFSRMLNTLDESIYMRGSEQSGLREYLHLQLAGARNIVLHAMRKVVGRVTLEEGIAWYATHPAHENKINQGSKPVLRDRTKKPGAHKRVRTVFKK